ncbi:MAG: hypothetical protein HKN26_03370 [Acidimicrobiales bacterium]|nr:hypothetical protein [Acidimicrobiales bacterium]
MTNLAGSENWALSVQRALLQPRPKWRGTSHTLAFFVSVPLAVVFVATRSSWSAAGVALIFAFGLSFMLGVSTVVHWKVWTPEQYHRLFQLDHTGIFMTVWCSAAPIAAYGLGGRRGWILFAIMFVGSWFGIFIEWLPFNPPSGMVNTVFLGLGWAPLLMIGWLWTEMTPRTFWLLMIGGAIYTVGALIVGSQWPDPSPEIFGYHEIWHLLVILGAGLHYVMAWILVP